MRSLACKTSESFNIFASCAAINSIDFRAFPLLEGGWGFREFQSPLCASRQLNHSLLVRHGYMESVKLPRES